MNPALRFRSIQLLQVFARALILAASLFSAGACAQTSTPSPSAKAKPKTQLAPADILRPYLGRWRPTSYSEGLNIGSLTITEDRFSVEVTGWSVTFVVDRQTDEGVIVRVTDRKPDDAFPGLKALAFTVETETVKGPPPAGITKTRELLWVCYLSDSLDRLASGIKKTCGNIYTR